MSSMPAQKPYSSKQDYGTPKEFLDAIRDKWGPITFDLAAHKGNHVADSYFAPKQLSLLYNPKKETRTGDELVQDLVTVGADFDEAYEAVTEAVINREKVKILVPNHDTEHAGFDSLSQDWVDIKSGGVWFLNPEYEDIGIWAEKCYRTALNGTMLGTIVMLIPASVGTNYFSDFIHEKSFVQFLSPRMSFDGLNPYPKDLLLAVYGLTYTGYTCWRWKD